MHKFEFVNRNYEMLEQQEKPKQFTYSDEKDHKKKPRWRKFTLTVSVLALFIIGIAVYFAKRENHSIVTETAGSGADKMPGNGNGSTSEKTPSGQLPAAGLSAEFEPEVMNEGAKASYKLALEVKGENQFAASAEIDVTNTSETNWNNLSVYFFPNQFGDLARDQCRRKIVTFAVDKCLQEIGEGETAIEKVTFNGEELPYDLQGVQLKVPLKLALSTGKSGKLAITYTFSLPGNLIENDEYNLLQWHPILPGYEREWLLHPLAIGKDTYSSFPSDITFSYNLPGKMQVVTSGTEPDSQSSSDTVAGKNLKEMFVMILNRHQMIKAQAGETEIRIFATAKQKAQAAEALKTAKEAVAFFEKKLGGYPQQQLDIVLTETRQGNYPGVILQPGTIVEDKFSYFETNESQEHLLVHQIAQQWFYGNVHFERHTDLWLNDGLSELAASLFFLVGKKKSEEESFAFAKKFNEFSIMREEVKSNMPADQYVGSFGGIVGHVQAKPAILLWELIKPYGDETALAFLSDYLKTYSGKKLATIEFIHFAKDYLKVDNHAFTGWLHYNPYSDYDMSDFYNL
ncbi:hypothetical protein D1B31_18885 [Neobacillus notoginsengisoli]|uniref:Peptidase M1 membrane alanine aminopeptidase domain-containing protein n=1 Tax=Neobacillus notoginsengisoli TaxID=1578198 RepID=A0A417YPV8_9BACI|nr:M1 family aminopeptidase [Neobacillus notoginsengisoli]RHW35709.1 hypothetical protein D1B31_18885 [Neobacillus notoginsengisoli]